MKIVRIALPDDEMVKAFDFTGVDRGSTGLPPIVRKVGGQETS